MDSKLTIRILVVTDGALNFEESKTNPDSLHIALEQLSGSRWHHFDLTKRRRGKNTFHDLQSFDQLWLFGAESNDSSKPEDDQDIEAITQFINSGKGVFATGDHGTLGRKLCGAIPRIKDMRSWHQTGDHKELGTDDPINVVIKDYLMDNRLDSRTSKKPIDHRGGHHDTPLEGDNVPKIIEPRMENQFGQTRAHFILTMPDGHPIRVLPDHAHEGECLDTVKDSQHFYKDDLPSIIADAHTKAGRINGNAFNMKSISYGVVAAYDPKPESNHGRIVVDSTFHHWKNSNVLPYESMQNADEQSQLIWQHIRQYYINIANWLVPYHKRHEAFRLCLDQVVSYAGIGNALDTLDLNISNQRIVAANAIIAELEKRYGEAFIAEQTSDSIHQFNTEAAAQIRSMLGKVQSDNKSSHISYGIFKTVQEEVIAYLYSKITGKECSEKPFACAISRINQSNQTTVKQLETINSST